MQDNFIDLNNFQIISTIEECEFNIIFLVEDKTTKIQYAAKVRKNNFANENEEKDFDTKMNAILKLKYPSILNYIGYSHIDFNNQPNPTIISEYLSQGTLYNLITKVMTSSAPNEWTGTKKYINLVGIALGMKYLHSNSIIHGNLNPTNILLDNDYYPRIINFHQPNTNALSILKEYLAPELSTNDPYTEKSDIYSFAIIAYQIITGKKPHFVVSNIPKFRNQDFLLKCLSKTPSERPTFDEICFYFSTTEFQSIFLDLNYIEISQYLESIKKEDDPYSQILYYSCYNQVERTESNKSKIITNTKIIADLGNDEAMLEYAIAMRLRNEILESNTYYLKSINKGNNHAMCRFYVESSTYKYFEMAINHGNIDAIKQRANHLRKEKDDDKKREAIKLYKIAIERGDPMSMKHYASMLRKGEGIPVNKQKAVFYYKSAIEKGVGEAMYEYARMLETGELGEPDYDEAIRLYKMGIEKGNKESMNNYGVMLHLGRGVPVNIPEAIKYYKMGIQKGNRDSMNNYAVLFFKGEGVPLNKPEAAKYFKMAADKGHLSAMETYANMCSDGDGIPVNKNIAIEYYKKAINIGSTNAMYNYAFILFNGDGIEANKTEAIKYFKMAADKGNILSIFEYALILGNGDGIDCDKVEAARYYKMGCDLDDTNCMINYGIMLLHGNGIKEDKEKAFYYFKKAVDLGNSYGMVNLAYMYYNGEACTSDINESERYIKMAIDAGNKYARHCYAINLIKNKDYTNAVIYLKMAIDKDDSVPSMIKYASMLKDGEGIPADKNEAARLYKMAIDKGSDKAMFLYGKMLLVENKSNSYTITFEKGKLKSLMMPCNNQEAVKYLKMAVDNNNADAMNEYANLLRYGIGVSLSKSEAIKYYKMSIEKKNIDAMKNYAEMLQNGEGVEINKDEAMRYLKMAEDEDKINDILVI